MNVMFCGNDRIFDGVLSCSLSILKRRKVKQPINFYILTMDLTDVSPDFKPVTDLQMKFLNECFSNEEDIKFIRIDVTKEYNEYLKGNPNEGTYCSPYTLLRLLVDVVPGIPEKILYLDVDILFNRDIRHIYDTDITDYDYAGTLDEYAKHLLPDYINAGVILFNIEHIKQSGYLTRCREMIKKRKWIWADQDALNFTKGKKLILSKKDNEQAYLEDKHSVCRHFCKRLKVWPYPRIVNIKQWNITNLHKDLHYYDSDDILFEYLYLKGKFNHEYLNKGFEQAEEAKNGKY